MQLITNEFLSEYPDQPEHMTELGAFVAYRTYTRWLDTEGRRETWKEAVARAVNYNSVIAYEQMVENKYPINTDALKAEAQVLFDNVFNLRQFLSGRTHWVGGADSKVADKFPLSNFNCSFLEIANWSDLSELFYLLLVGTGVGFSASKEVANNLPPIRTDFKLIHSEYKPVAKEERLEDTTVELMTNGYAIIRVGDSKEGWVAALKEYICILTEPDSQFIHTIKMSYNSIRPSGERLKTFGGTASGYEPLQEMFEGIKDVLQNKIDTSLEPLEIDMTSSEIHGVVYHRVRPIHILDIGNLIGNNVVVGGVRRTAEIFLADSDDWEVIFAKYGINGIWDEEKHNKVIGALDNVGINLPWLENLAIMDGDARPLHHRRMSNNSVGFKTKPSREMLNLLFTIMQSEGEPGFVNLEEANRRRPNAKGLNPCAEILLDSYGVCNLTTVNVVAFVNEDGTLDFPGLMEAQALSTRAGIRMTCLSLELPHWDAVHKRDRLIGTSLTGWYDAMDLLDYNEEQEAQLLNLLEEAVNMEAMKYCALLRIPVPLVSTTVKPEGTLSQVAGGVSSGLHRSHSSHYIRRIRINATDPLVKVAQELNWTIHAEIGTAGSNVISELAKPEVIAQARTLVIDFPVASGAKKTKDDVYVKEQFDTYFRFQDHYTQHNSSNTIHVRDDEWAEVEEIVWNNWENFVGVSFLAYDGGSYLLAPYEAVTEEAYNTLKDSMGSFDKELLNKYELGGLVELEEDDAECATGACPIR